MKNFFDISIYQYFLFITISLIFWFVLKVIISSFLRIMLPNSWKDKTFKKRMKNCLKFILFLIFLIFFTALIRFFMGHKNSFKMISEIFGLFYKTPISWFNQISKQ